MGTLDEKVAIVTGSSSGIGEATARSLADAGASVVVNSSRSVDRARRLPNRCRPSRSMFKPTSPTRIRTRRSSPGRSTGSAGSTSS